ncbi:GPP34 family phosphoprotein [Bacillus salitolerans]|uniref:GPP34 family phosphoprotein n=1 Tax=Bacillus salitolerans TaxID=1437434 RepID=A0ABW4LSS0_9BACI
MLTLAEKFLLLMIDDETGKMAPGSSTVLPYGLAGAIIIDLSLKGCLDYKDKKVFFLDKENAGDPILTNMLGYLKSKGTSRKLNYLVQKLGYEISRKKISESFINRLVEKEILQMDEVQYLFFFTKKVYPSNNTGTENEIRSNIRQLILEENSQHDEESIALIGLLKACNLDKSLFSKEEYKLAKKKITKIMKEIPYGKAVNEAIMAMQSAVMASIIAATAATTSTSGG